MSKAAEPPLEELLGSTLGRRFALTAGEFPDREAVVIPELGVRKTYRELKCDADLAAKAFMALGIGKGEHVAIWSSNRAEWHQAAYAAWKIGAVVVSVNTLFKAAELSHALAVSDATTLVMASGFRDLDYVETLYQLAPELREGAAGDIEAKAFPRLKRVLVLDDAPLPGMLSFKNALARAGSVADEELAKRESAVSPGDPATMIFTSGTTGVPKGALLRHRSVLAEAFYSGREMGLKAGDRCLLPLPFFTIGGMQTGIVMPVCHAITAVSVHWFDAGKALQIIQEERITLAIMVNTMWVATLDLPDFGHFDLSSLTRGFSAGAPCPVAMMREIEQRYGITMTIGYGLSETSAVVVSTNPACPEEKRLGSVGRPLPGVEVKIVDRANGTELAAGEQGEVCLRGWCNMIGYYQRPEATAEALDRDGWLHTGDLGFVEEEGFLHITGRFKDVIIRGGQNIAAREIEDLLHIHPRIADAYVIGVPSRKYGEEVLAAVMLRSGQELSEEEVKQFCKANLARYKVPSYVWFVDSFPANAMGKTQKFRLIDMAVRQFGLEKKRGG